MSHDTRYFPEVDVRYRMRVRRVNAKKQRAAIADAARGAGEFRMDSD